MHTVQVSGQFNVVHNHFTYSFLFNDVSLDKESDVHCDLRSQRDLRECQLHMTFKELTNEGSFVAYCCKAFCVTVKTCKQKSASDATAFRAFECLDVSAGTLIRGKKPFNNYTDQFIERKRIEDIIDPTLFSASSLGIVYRPLYVRKWTR